MPKGNGSLTVICGKRHAERKRFKITSISKFVYLKNITQTSCQLCLLSNLFLTANLRELNILIAQKYLNNIL